MSMKKIISMTEFQKLEKNIRVLIGERLMILFLMMNGRNGKISKFLNF